MNAVLADTSYYVALLSPRDQHHAAAKKIASELRRPIVVTEFVLLELANAYSATESRRRLPALWDFLRSEPTVSIVPASSELLGRGFSRFVERLDKEWSLTDCISFMVMEERGITEALSSDHHFEQAGFTILF
jgi:predicted nucleic acid-binding protein